MPSRTKESRLRFGLCPENSRVPRLAAANVAHDHKGVKHPTGATSAAGRAVLERRGEAASGALASVIVDFPTAGSK
jgi:hypothetical protein